MAENTSFFSNENTSYIRRDGTDPKSSLDNVNKSTICSLHNRPKIPFDTEPVHNDIPPKNWRNKIRNRVVNELNDILKLPEFYYGYEKYFTYLETPEKFQFFYPKPTPPFWKEGEDLDGAYLQGNRKLLMEYFGEFIAPVGHHRRTVSLDPNDSIISIQGDDSPLEKIEKEESINSAVREFLLLINKFEDPNLREAIKVFIFCFCKHLRGEGNNPKHTHIIEEFGIKQKDWDNFKTEMQKILKDDKTIISGIFFEVEKKLKNRL